MRDVIQGQQEQSGSAAARLACSVLATLALLAGSAAADFNLRYVDHTGIEIAIAWDPVPDATAYVIGRDTVPTFDSGDFISYSLDATVTGFGDTGWPLDDWRRFRWRSSYADSGASYLAPGTSYYYQVVAQTPAGPQSSNVIGPCQIADYHSAAEVVRGVPGDLWADAVLGKPSFAENTYLKTDPYHLQQAGGVVLDKDTRPTHVFIMDANHNRVLGLEGLGRCSTSQALCTIQADCDPDENCDLKPGEIAPSVVLGQPNATDFGACNLNGTMQAFPNYDPPSASTLCFMDRAALSVGESDITIQAAMDRDHNLYVPDIQNHRVLMYRDPFDPANGTAATAVWGQDSFDAGACNKGDPLGRTMTSLCGPNSVDIDTEGNLWVCDGAEVNSRVLRFPRDALTGTISQTADIQLTGFWHPVSVRVDQQGTVYVDDWYGVWFVAAPQPGAANTPQNLRFISNDRDRSYSTQMAFDPTHPTQLWVELSHESGALYDLGSQKLLKKVHTPLMHGMDVSQTGDLFTVDSWTGLYRLAPGQQPGPWTPGDLAFLTGGAVTLDSLSVVTGITTAGNQLLVSDREGVLFWNDYHAITQGQAITQPADGMWTGLHGPYFVKSDSTGRIWIGGWSGPLQIFEGPLTSDATPVKTVEVWTYKNATGALAQLPGGQPLASWQFQPVGSGDQVWITDGEGSPRVLRVTNVDGLEAPGQPPYVDAVLGQRDVQRLTPNKGRGPFGFARDTLGGNAIPLLDFDGNLYVQDNATFGVDGGETRLLRWNASSLPQNVSATVYNLLPDNVYGFGGAANFTAAAAWQNAVYPYPTTEPANAPRAPAFDQQGRMVLGGGNPYEAARFPLVYLNKEQNYAPQLALGDFVSFPSVSHVDPDGNVYLGDFDWFRVLVYKTPLSQFSAAPQITPAPLCTILSAGQTSWHRPSLRARYLGDGKYGNDGLTITTQFTMATGDFTIDPLANGAQIEIRSGAGVPRIRADLPGGPYRRPGPGWSVNRAGTKYTFKDLTATGTNGIRSVVVTDLGAGKVRVVIYAKYGAFPLLPSDRSLTVTIVLGGAASGAAGECGQTTLLNCRTNAWRNVLLCGQ